MLQHHKVCIHWKKCPARQVQWGCAARPSPPAHTVLWALTMHNAPPPAARTRTLDCIPLLCGASAGALAPGTDHQEAGGSHSRTAVPGKQKVLLRLHACRQRCSTQRHQHTAVTDPLMMWRSHTESPPSSINLDGRQRHATTPCCGFHTHTQTPCPESVERCHRAR